MEILISNYQSIFNSSFRSQSAPQNVQVESAQSETTLLDLPDETLIKIYDFLDDESVINLMETCKRNFNVINSFLPPRYYVDESRIRENFEFLFNSDRNFKNLSLDISKNGFYKLLQFLKKVGGMVRILDIKLLKCNSKILDKVLKLCPLREKLRVGFHTKFEETNFYTDSITADIGNLTELAIYQTHFSYPHVFVDLNHFKKLKLEKLTLETATIIKSEVDEDILSFKWNLKELKLMDCYSEN